MKPMDFEETNGSVISSHEDYPSIPFFAGEEKGTRYVITSFTLTKKEVVQLLSGKRLWLITSLLEIPITIPVTKSPFASEEPEVSQEN